MARSLLEVKAMGCTIRSPVLDEEDAGAQPFPRTGPVAEQLNRSFSDLRAGIGDALLARPVYSYIVTTAKFVGSQFRQTGSAPNFQDGRITLCTCKHKDRASPPPVRKRGPIGDDPWQGIWVAGLCSSTQLRPRALFYMMLVEQTFGHHAAAWESLRSPLAKSAHREPFGDIYEPLKLPCPEPWKASSYKPHLPGHVHDAKPRAYDIERSFHGRHPRLLIGDPRRSYLWSQPKVALQAHVDMEWASAHHRFYPKLSDFLELCR
jgi:hypothetical protein